MRQPIKYQILLKKQNQKIYQSRSVNKSKLRSKILNLRKKSSYKKLRLFPERIFQFFKKNKINLKNVGGYYPCNHEIDDLDLLNFLRKKKIKYFITNNKRK